MKDKRQHTICFPLLIPTVFMLCSACAGVQEESETIHMDRPEALTMEMGSFYYKPDHIVLENGGTLLIHLTNVSDSKHNLTVKNPEEEIIATVDLAGGKSGELRLDLRAPGIYPFYCDIPFHTTLGMEGRFEVK
ncbi:MAG: cupredoxin domain-containing protein [Desulfobacterales bacterium]